MIDVPLRVWADIDLDALTHNLAVLRAPLPPATGVVGLVKADAYGHGAPVVAWRLRDEGVREFGIATLDEALELRQAGLTEPLWHLGVPRPDEAEAVLALGVVPSLSGHELADALEAALPPGAPPYPVHLKLDTGMGRRGLNLDQALALWRRVGRVGKLAVEALCMHFATADGDLAFAREQLRRFVEWRAALAAEGLEAPLAHAANGPATLRLPESHFDRVRPGMALYGVAAFDAPGVEALRPVMRVASRLVLTKDLPAGHEVGYAHGCRLERDTRVGLVPIGYGDGWSWRLSGAGTALVGGARVPYLGRVNMDMIQVDLNNAPTARVGDEVTLMGRDGGEQISAVELARAAGVSEYTLSTCLGRRVTRRFMAGGRVVARRGLDGVLREGSHGLAVGER